MKPTSLLIPALGLLASSAISATISKRSTADIHRGESLPGGVVTFADVSKRGKDHVEGVIRDLDGTIDGVVTEVGDNIEGVVPEVGDTLDGVVTSLGISKRGENHAEEGVHTYPDVSKRGKDHAEEGVSTYPDVSKLKN